MCLIKSVFLLIIRQHGPRLNPDCDGFPLSPKTNMRPVRGLRLAVCALEKTNRAN